MDNQPNPLLILDGCTKVSPATGLFISVAGSTIAIAAVLWRRRQVLHMTEEELRERSAKQKRPR